MTLGFLTCTTGRWGDDAMDGSEELWRRCVPQRVDQGFFCMCVKMEMPVSYPNTDVKQAVGFRMGAQKRSLGAL